MSRSIAAASCTKSDRKRSLILPLYRLLSSTIPLQGMIPVVIMEMTARDLRMVFQFHFAPFLAL